MALLSDSEISSIAKEVRGIVGDSSVGVTIKYRIMGTTPFWNWDAADQELEPIEGVFAESSVSAFKGSYRLDEIGKNGIESGDVKFILMNSAITGILSITDEIYEPPSTEQSGTTYDIKNIKMDPLEICYFIQARSIG